jgi:hypothetical protein
VLVTIFLPKGVLGLVERVFDRGRPAAPQPEPEPEPVEVRT